MPLNNNFRYKTLYPHSGNARTQFFNSSLNPKDLIGGALSESDISESDSEPETKLPKNDETDNFILNEETSNSKIEDDPKTENSESDSDVEIKKKDEKTTKIETKMFNKYFKDITKTYAFPSFTDPKFQEKIYISRRFQSNRIPSRDHLKTYEQIKEYRDNHCSGELVLRPHQNFISNFLNPFTPFAGLLAFHGTGTGKCITGDALIYINGKMRCIEQVWNKYKTKKIIDPEDGEWSLPKKPLYIRTLIEKTGKIINKRVDKLYRQKIHENLVEVTLDNGRLIKITEQHKLLTVNGWTNKFSVGDFVAVPSIEDARPTGSTESGVNKNTKKLISELGRDIHYIKIISVRKFIYSGYVYDLEIPTTHNYVANNIICHNTCAAIATAEQFIPMVQKYGTKIHILVPGPNLKEVWKDHIIKCTGDKYLKVHTDKGVNMSDAERNRFHKTAINTAMPNYKIMSYNSFYKKVSGVRIIDKKTTKEGKIKTQYRKTEEGEFERDLSIDRIDSLDNTLLIVDEAHSMTGNFMGEALKKILTLTATPMKNYADDIIDMLNFVRPQNSPIIRDKIFTSDKNHLMAFKEGGEDYLRKMCKGYVSYLRGADPLVFAKRVDYGIIPKGLIFTKTIPCIMHEFQKKIYDTIEVKDDTLDRRSSSASMFIFPGLDNDKKEIKGFFGREGLSQVRQQLKSYQDVINKKLYQLLVSYVKEDIQNGELENYNTNLIPTSELIYPVDNKKTISGKILKLPLLKYFSTKFYIALSNINRLVYGDEGAQTGFVYCNFVKTGIELFQEILLQNGYLEFQETSNYVIKPDTVCYYCGKTFTEHKKIKETKDKSTKNKELQGGKPKKKKSSEKSTRRSKKKSTKRKTSLNREQTNQEKKKSDYILSPNLVINTPIEEIPPHVFHPATFITVKGASTEEGTTADAIPADKQRIIREVFNKLDNREGKFLKLILGSRVMNEGISLNNCRQVHILDVYYNFARVDQVAGRTMRECSHYGITGDHNKFPFVGIYKYAITLRKKINSDSASNKREESIELSTEEELYRKAELKIIKIKAVERILKEEAIDCPLNYTGNVFKEDLNEYKDCTPADPSNLKENVQKPCPAICDYTNCLFKCSDTKLNIDYYDPTRNIYKAVSKSELDYTTFSQTLARTEIDWAKSKIKDLYRIENVYTLKNIIKYIKNAYDKENKDLFDDFFVYQALNELIPLDENDFNNFKDIIYDKLNKPGYLIYRNKYYVFNPFDENDDAPMYHRTVFKPSKTNKLGLLNYINNIDKKLMDGMENKESVDLTEYDFEGGLEYYEGREENDIVGIINREPTKKKSKTSEEVGDTFNIRIKREKILSKKRGTGIPSLKGAVCHTSKDLNYLLDVAKKLNIPLDTNYRGGKGGERYDLCNRLIKVHLLNLEKYNEDNKTYMIIPKNHKLYPFPYNIHDRTKYIQTNLKNEIRTDFEMKTAKVYDKRKIPKYVISITDDANIKDYTQVLKKYEFVLKKKKWELTID